MSMPAAADGSARPPGPAPPPASTVVNFAANSAGSVLTSLIQFAVIPVYIRLLGAESYGLIGVQTTLQALAQLLDFGVSASINRELARRTALNGEPADIRDLVRTLEVLYAAVGLALGALVWSGAPLAERWLNHQQLSAATVRHSVQAMAFLLAAQWPLTFYQGAMLGLQRHRLFNTIRVAATTLSAAGSIVVLTRISATPVALFAWQALVAVAQVVALAVWVWFSLPRDRVRSRVRLSSASGLWRFAAGMTGVTATALFLSQVDRIVVSRVLPLQAFGYYMLGATLANALLYTFISPVYASVFPRLSSLVAVGDSAGVQGAYRRAWSLMALLAVPAAAAVSMFAQPLIFAWTGDESAARTAAPIAALLVSGMALYGLVSTANALQLAHGWSTLVLSINSVLCLAALPTVLLLTRRYEAVGAAAIWPLINVGSALVNLPLTARRLPEEATLRWLPGDIVVPGAAGAATVWAVRRVVSAPAGLVATLATVGLAWLAAVAVMVAVSPMLRQYGRRLLLNRAPMNLVTR